MSKNARLIIAFTLEASAFAISSCVYNTTSSNLISALMLLSMLVSAYLTARALDVLLGFKE